MTTIQNRKRNRSVEYNDVITQSKQFVNQRMVDSLNEQCMKNVFAKTVDLLFEGSRNLNNNEIYKSKNEKCNNIRLSGDGKIDFMNGDEKPNGVLDETVSCNSCNRKSLYHSECSSCNLKLCEYCGFSCLNCTENLCQNCIQLFGCQANGHPCCGTCQMFTSM